MFANRASFEAAVLVAVLAGALAVLGEAAAVILLVFAFYRQFNVLIGVLVGFRIEAIERASRPQAVYRIEPFIWPDGKVPAEVLAGLTQVKNPTAGM